MTDPAQRRAWWLWMRQWLDLVLVVGLTAFTAALLPVLDDAARAYRTADVWAVLLVCAAGVASALRRRWPVESLLLCGAGVGTYLVASYPYGPVFGFVLLTVYAVARHRPPARSASLAILVYAMLIAHLPFSEAAIPGLGGLVPALAWVAIPYSVGAARRAVVAAAVRERVAADQRLVDTERLRLSQEVHDLVGHGLAAIQMQADIALHVRQTRPEQTQDALEAISRTSSQALDELRATLAAAHPDEEARTASRAPTPGLARVEELCQRVEEAGIQVTLRIEGDVQPLPAAPDIAAYRVLQEALTNVVKHSAHQHADVRIQHSVRAVTLTVSNQDLGPPPTGGIGITGMRRRVLQMGGTFRAGHGHRSTFQVRATIPRAEEDA